MLVEAHDRARAGIQHQREKARREAVGLCDPGREVGLGGREEGAAEARGAPAAGAGAAGHGSRRRSGQGRGLGRGPGRLSDGYRGGAEEDGAARSAGGAEDLVAGGVWADGFNESQT